MNVGAGPSVAPSTYYLFQGLITVIFSQLGTAILVPQFILAIVGFSDATKITFRLRPTPPPLSSTDGKSGVVRVVFFVSLHVP